MTDKVIAETPLAHLRTLIAEWQYDAAISLSYAVMNEQGSPEHQSFAAECRMSKKHADQLSALVAYLEAAQLTVEREKILHAMDVAHEAGYDPSVEEMREVLTDVSRVESSATLPSTGSTAQSANGSSATLRRWTEVLCQQCGGNGVIKIHHGVSVCLRCDGRCYEPEPVAWEAVASLPSSEDRLASIRESRQTLEAAAGVEAVASRPAAQEAIDPVTGWPIIEWSYEGATHGTHRHSICAHRGDIESDDHDCVLTVKGRSVEAVRTRLAWILSAFKPPAAAAPAVEGARPQEEKDRNDHARVDTPGTPVDSLTAPTDEPVRHFRSCCCPAAHGENCPLTPDECDARTADYIGIPWFGARLRKVWDGFVHESLNGVVCSIPDTGLETAPHRTWCVRCQRRYMELKTLVEMLESHMMQVAGACPAACVETIERLVRTYANPPMPLTDDERAAVAKALDAAAAPAVEGATEDVRVCSLCQGGFIHGTCDTSGIPYRAGVAGGREDALHAFVVQLFNLVMGDLEWVRAQGGRHSVCPLCHCVCERDGGPGHADDCPRIELARQFDAFYPPADGKKQLDRPALAAAWQLALDRNIEQLKRIEELEREIARLQGLLNATITTAARS